MSRSHEKGRISMTSLSTLRSSSFGMRWKLRVADAVWTSRLIQRRAHDDFLPAACNGVHRSRSFAFTSPPYSIKSFKIWSLLSIEHWWIGVRPSSLAVLGEYLLDWRRLRTSSTSWRAVAKTKRVRRVRLLHTRRRLWCYARCHLLDAMLER